MKTVFKESEIPKEAREEYERIENKFLEEEFHTKEKGFKTIKELKKEIELKRKLAKKRFLHNWEPHWIVEIEKSQIQTLKDILKLIDKETKELQEIDKKIPEKFKELVDDETNQHMRIQASLSMLEEFKQKLEGV